MNAPISFRERHALTLHNRMQGMPVMDPTNHLQRIQVVSQNRAIGAQYLEQIKQRCAPAPSGAGARKSSELAHITCWHDTPELYRKMLARAAGLGPEVVGKLDRDLSEREKALLRSAARDLRDCAAALVNI